MDDVVVMAIAESLEDLPHVVTERREEKKQKQMEITVKETVGV